MAGEKTILLVEDNADDEALTLRALAKGRVKNRIVVVRDGAEALDYLLGAGKYESRALGDPPQVVLLDLKLPKVDGIEVLKRIRAEPGTRTLPVVILTSSREERDLVAAYSNGASSYVVKPLDMVQFTEAVQHLELYWLVLNEPAPPPARQK